LISLPLIGAYSATEYAIEAITDTLRMELWDINIKVITINPGLIKTKIYTISKPKIDNLIENKSSRFSELYGKYLYNVPKGLSPNTIVNAKLEAISPQKPKTMYLVTSTMIGTGIRLKRFVPSTIFFSQVATRIHDV